jgi:hypothetical protein
LLALLFGAEAVLDLAGFVEADESEAAGALELAGAGAAAPEFELEGVAAGADVFVSAALADFDFFVLADFVPASASLDAAVSADDALADFDFELVDFVPAAESVEAVESAFASVEEAFADFFLELVDFASDAESADAVSPDDAFADLDFFELVAAVELPEESLSEVDFAFFDFDVEDFPEEDASLESVELASVDFFFLVVFFAGVVLESLESVACAFTGAALASASPRPVEIKNANRYFLNRFILFPPQFARFLERRKACLEPAFARALCVEPCGSETFALRIGRACSARASQDLRASAQIRFSGLSSDAALVETSTTH